MIGRILLALALMQPPLAAAAQTAASGGASATAVTTAAPAAPFSTAQTVVRIDPPVIRDLRGHRRQ